MRPVELLLIPNLLSLSRIALTPAVGYFLWRNDSASTTICLVLLVVAGVTDALDGWTARKLGQTSQLGLVLDPLADKIFAAVLLIELVLFRAFPVWLALAIIGRDLIILTAGSFLLGKKRISIGSTLTGKYAFFSIVVLIGCSVLRFETGVDIVAVVTLLLLAGSLVVYAGIFARHLRGETQLVFLDKPLYKWLRVGATVLICGLLIWIFIAERLGFLHALQ